MANDKEKKDLGTISGIIIVIIILLVGAFYIVGQRIQKSKEFQAKMNIEKYTATSATSDDISTIEKDAQSMNFDNLGTGINNL